MWCFLRGMMVVLEGMEGGEGRMVMVGGRVIGIGLVVWVVMGEGYFGDLVVGGSGGVGGGGVVVGVDLVVLLFVVFWVLFWSLF